MPPMLAPPVVSGGQLVDAPYWGDETREGSRSGGRGHRARGHRRGRGRRPPARAGIRTLDSGRDRSEVPGSRARRRLRQCRHLPRPRGCLRRAGPDPGGPLRRRSGGPRRRPRARGHGAVGCHDRQRRGRRAVRRLRVRRAPHLSARQVRRRMVADRGAVAALLLLGGARMTIVLAFVLLLGLVGVLVIAARRSPAGEGGDSGQPVRRFFEYLLLYGLVVVVANGGSGLLSRLIDRGELVRFDDAQLARSLAFLVIGLHLYVALGWWSFGRLRSDPEERRSLGLAVYITFASLTAIGVVMVS